MSKIRAAILVGQVTISKKFETTKLILFSSVSDTASVDTSADKSGPTIREILSEQGYECKNLLVVPDDESRIQTVVQSWCEQGDVDWIITTGGTGFGVRDRTPEVCNLHLPCQLLIAGHARLSGLS